MKTSEKTFTIPFAIFADSLPPTTFVILVYLISQSDYCGHLNTDYMTIMENCFIRNRNTVSTSLTLLQKLRWIIRRKKLQDGVALTVNIPHRLRQKLPIGVLPSDVIKMPNQAG